MSPAAEVVVYPLLAVGIIFMVWFNIKICPLAFKQMRAARAQIRARKATGRHGAQNDE